MATEEPVTPDENPEAFDSSSEDYQPVGDLEGGEPGAPLEEDQEAAWEGEGGQVRDEKVDWEDPSEEKKEDEGEDGDAQSGGVQVGLSPIGPVIVVTAPDGTSTQKVITVEECFLLGGQLLGIGSFVMGMGMQQQMQEAARMAQMMQQGEKRSKGGVYHR